VGRAVDIDGGGVGDCWVLEDWLEITLTSLLMEMPLRGLHDINKVFIKSGKANKFDENEGFKLEVEWMLHDIILIVKALVDCDGC
ncbi:hypothetical protein Tco_1170158, partial [Tanacetum coccineum]